MILPVFPNVEGIADCRFRTVMKTAEAKGAGRLFPGGASVFHFDRLDRTLFRAQAASYAGVGNGKKTCLPHQEVKTIHKKRQLNGHFQADKIAACPSGDFLFGSQNLLFPVSDGFINLPGVA